MQNSNGLAHEVVVSFFLRFVRSVLQSWNRIEGCKGEFVMSKIAYYTKDGLEKLKGELSLLKSKGRADIARQIADARDKGDLSENAEYDAAKDAQGHLEAKFAQ